MARRLIGFEAHPPPGRAGAEGEKVELRRRLKAGLPATSRTLLVKAVA